MSLLGVDIGSSRCKAVVFAPDGAVLAESVAGYTPQLPAPGRVEMDPEVLWAAVAGAVRRAAEAAGEPVEAVGLSSHGESFVAIDGHDRPLGPAIMNTDTRAVEEARWWEREIGRERIFAITGLIAHPMYPMAKLRWLRAHEPDTFAAAHRFISLSEYVLTRLGLAPQIAYPLACRFMAFDVRAREWSEEMLSAAGLTPDRLPVPVPAGTGVGALSPAVASELALPAGVPVVVGGHDQPCGALGMGALRPGMVTNSLGTYECLVAVTDEPALDDTALSASVNSYCHVVPDQYITIAYFPAGIMVRWFCETFCGEQAAAARARGTDIYERLEAVAPDGPSGLCITPHLIGSANPHFDPRATGAIVGLTPAAGPGHIYKGILEGLACELAIVSDLLAASAGPFDVVRCTGGGARSKLGLQLRATITQRSMQTLRSQEAVCLGVALLAGVHAGVYRDLEQAVGETVKVAETIAPDPASAATYRRQVERYRRLYPALAPLREL